MKRPLGRPVGSTYCHAGPREIRGFWPESDYATYRPVRADNESSPAGAAGQIRDKKGGEQWTSRAT
jgi:hypothetical protein